MKTAAPKTALALMVALLLGLTLAGCTTHRGPDAKIDFPDMHIEVDPSGTLPAKFWDSYSLFNDANRLFDQKQYDKARPLYEKLVANYPTDDLAPLSLFNAAVCTEEAGQYAQALTSYDRLVQLYPGAIDAVRLSFRYAYCNEKLEQWTAAIQALNQVNANPNATPVQKLQADARIAIATYYSGQYDLASKKLRAVMETYEDYRRRRITVDNYFYAKSCFTLGEFYFERYQAVELGGEQDELEGRFENKGTLFILARAQYTKAIKTYDAEYTVASMFRIGQGYEIFYFSLIRAPLPTDLRDDQKEKYIRTLREYAQPALMKSIKVYQRNLKLGDRLAVQTPWLIQTRKRLEYLEQWQKENL